jgi:hypothetical protein
VQEGQEFLMSMACRWRGMQAASTAPLSTFSAAHNVVVPWRLQSWVTPSTQPKPMGSMGCVRTSGCVRTTPTANAPRQRTGDVIHALRLHLPDETQHEVQVRFAGT